MLKQRVITALVLSAGFLALILLANPLVFSLAMSAVVLLVAWEWANLSGYAKPLPRALYAAAVGAVIYLVAWLVARQQLITAQNVFVFAAGWWAVGLLWVQGYPGSSVFWQARPARLLMGLLVMVPAWHALIFLRAADNGQWLVLNLILLVAAADIGAYFTGKAMGRHKLAPQVSPGKTWEGVLGGVAVAVITMAVIMLATSSKPIYWALVIAIPTALVSVLGDLLESMVKRHRGLKDSGTILPGHGGVCDRVDGLVAAAPIFALTLLAAGWY